MEKPKQKIKISFGPDTSSMSDQVSDTTDAANDSAVMAKLEAIRNALQSGDNKAALSMVNEALGAQKEDIQNGEKEGGSLADEFHRKMEGA